MLWGIDTRWLYCGLIGLVVAERLVELFLTQRNARRLRRRGGFEISEDHYSWMVSLHTALLIACPLEVGLLSRPWVPSLSVAMLALLGATMALRYWAISSLGDRWTTRVFVVPGEPVVRRGPYRWLRHPNYLAVVFEVVALPLIHSAWLSAIVFGIGNIFLLKARIQVEEKALTQHSGPDDS